MASKLAFGKAATSCSAPKRESNPWISRFRGLVELIPAFAGMTWAMKG